MSESLSKSPSVVGAKETKRALLSGTARLVYYAADADERIVAPVLALAGERGVDVMRMATMRDLGRAFGIPVGAALAAVLGEPG